MTSTPMRTTVRPRTLDWRPTPALVASVALASAFALVGIVLARPQLLALALAFAVPAVRGLWVRGRCTGSAAITQSATELQEGQAVTVGVRVTGASATISSLAWTPAALEETRPASGSATGLAPQIEVEPRQWGRHLLGPVVASVEDQSGLWRATLPPEKIPLRVRPKASRMVGGSGVNAPVGLNGAHVSSVRGEGTEIADVREYRPGDRMRRVVWRLSARSEGDDLHVVESRTERDTDVLVVLDTLNPAQEVGPEPESSLDVGMRAATALADHYLGFGDRVGVHDLGWRIGDLPARSGPRQAMVFTELVSCAARGPLDGRRPLRRTPVQPPGTLCFVCTPLLDDEVLTEIGRLRSMGCEVVVIDTLPEHIASTVPGQRRDAETRRLVQAWELRRLFRDDVLDGLARHGVPVTSWRGPTSLAGVLLAMEQSGRPRLARR
ncbi:DUF58 domain-containing protein [Luteococcus sanguinis]|uniref:DUF58 domain-containing protein n=1 Tax=Luteococcus sanguinis TaxID=174038 RepID=A0ABW1WZK2_9ACTN